MKKMFFAILILASFVSACAQAKPATTDNTGLKVTVGSNSKSYTAADLKELGAAQATFTDVDYVGVVLSELLKDAGADLSQAKAVKVIASDGFTVNYEPALLMKEDTLIAYARADGALTADDGSYRMVLPGQEGKLNPRQVVEIQVVQ